MRKPSVLLINRVYPPVHGATGRLLGELARSLAQQGYRVHVITSGPKAMKERDGSISITRVRGDAKPKSAAHYGVVWIRMFMVALMMKRFDLVITMSDPPFLGFIGRILQIFKRAKHIHWAQDVYPDLFPVIGVSFPKVVLKIMDRMALGAMEKADHCVVIGRCMARIYAQKGVLPKQMSIIPNWADKELVGDEAHEAPSFYGDDLKGDVAFRAHEEQVKSAPKFRVLYAGNIGLVHPIDTILKAAGILQNQHPEIEFLFVGDGPRYDDLRALKVRDHLDNIRLLPYQPAVRLRELMRSGDVHLMSLDDGAMGLSVPCKFYSAVAAHRPCVFVGPADSEAAQVIGDYGLGDVIAHGASEALAEAILRFRVDGQRWFAVQEAAGAAADVFVPQASIDAWRHLIDVMFGIDREFEIDDGELPGDEACDDDEQAQVAAE